MQKLLLFVDKVSTWVGQAFSWLIVSLTLLISWEVFSRYALDHPHAWAFDVMIMMYGTLFMMAGAYTLAQERPRARRRALRILPAARCRPGSTWRCTCCSSSPASSRSSGPATSMPAESWAIREGSNITADGPPYYPFKTIIPIAGAFLLLQGIVEIIRCVICLKAGRLAVARGRRAGSGRRQAEEDGARQGLGHRRGSTSTWCARADGARQMRKEVWFGLSIMAAVVIMLFVLMPAPSR